VKTFTLFAVFGVKVTMSAGGVIAFVAAMPLVAWLSTITVQLSFAEAILAGLLGAVVIFLSDLLHQFGHAYVARRLGYPMRGIHFHSILSASVYPPDEPPLPRHIHVKRALGGFWVNILIGLFLLPYAFFLSFEGGATGFVTMFSALYNFVILGLGALFPIDIPGVFTNDGGALYNYWRASQAEKRRPG
jgi:hypothetical protein